MATSTESYKSRLPPSLRPTSVWTHPLHFLLSWTLVITVTPLVIPILTSLYIYRAIIRLLARYNANLTTPLTPYDTIFAVDSYYTRPYASNLTVLEMKSRVDLDTVKRLFKSRILDDPCFEKLSYIPVEYISYWFWKKLDYPRLEEGVELYYDSELHEQKSVDDCLKEIVEMPFREQLFNVLVMHFGNKSYIVFRIHHTVCDGYSFNHLIDKFVGLQSKYLVKKNVVTWGSMLREFKENVGKWLILMTHLPLHIITLFCESVTHTPNFYTVRKHNASGLIRRTIIPLSSIKKIRSSTQSHVASIGMSLMTGALQKYYDETTPTTTNSTLRPQRLAIMHSLPKPNHPLNKLCNHWGVGLFKIPFIKDSVARMYGAEEDFKEYTGLGYDTVLHIHFPIVVLVPTWIVKWFFSINFGTSCGFTSVPGLFDKIAYVGDHDDLNGVNNIDDDGLNGKSKGVEVAHMWKVFGLQWRQSAVAVAMYTYRGEASITFYANKDIIPDNHAMDRVIQLFHEEFNELVAHSSSSSTIDKLHHDHDNNVSKEMHHHNGKLSNGISVAAGKLIDACFSRDNKLA